ncbi:MAG: hypothetical protein PHN42_05255 [Bacilli bacterium]|nr:hypothetical protein [Bacilli bacterium]
MTDFIMMTAKKRFEEYENLEKITSEDIKKLEKILTDLEALANENGIELTEENKQELKLQFDNIKSKLVLSNNDLKNSVSDLVNEPSKFSVVKESIKNSKLMQTIGKVKLIKESKKAKATGLKIALFALSASTIATVASCAKKEHDIQNTKVAINSEIDKINNDAVTDKAEEILEVGKAVSVNMVLPENLAFDPNSNTELVNRLSTFIVDIMAKGIAVKDFMTEEEIENAENNNISFTTVSKLMDYYFVMNINDIDPSDYARLKYNTKTTDMIINNYMAVANLLMDDLLTVKQDTVIDFTQIIADKESAKALQVLPNMIASLNEENIKSSEISNYIEENYIKEYTDMPSASVNEQTYRFMFSFDELTNGKGIPSDINIILNEDETYSCQVNKKDGEKNKSERSQEYTDIKNIIDDKLNLTTQYINQDLSNISEEELKIGYILEDEIEEKVKSLNPVFNPNPKYEAKEIETAKSSKKAVTSTNGKTPSQVIGDNGLPIANEELQLMGIDPSNPNAKAMYEQAVKSAFEQKAAADSSHTITDTDGNIVVSGASVNATLYNNGYAEGYTEGNQLQSYSPSNSDASFTAGYSEGYALGKADRQALDASINKSSTTTFQDVPDTIVNQSTTETTQNYTGNVTSTPSTDTPTTFEPAPTESVTIISEEVTEQNYTSSVKNQLLDLKKLLININSDLDEVLNTDKKI